MYNPLLHFLKESFSIDTLKIPRQFLSIFSSRKDENRPKY